MGKDITRLLKQPAIILLLLAVIAAIIAIAPHYAEKDGKIFLETNIKTGLDLKGGVLALLEPEDKSPETVEKTITILETRINSFGLTETKIRRVGDYIQVEMAGATEKQIREILSGQGKFEAKIPVHIEWENQTHGTFRFEQEHTVILDNNTVTVDGTKLGPGETTQIEGITISVPTPTETNNETGDVILYATAFTGEEVVKVFKDATRQKVYPVEGGFRFEFVVLLTNEAAERFAKITKNIPIAPGGEHLEEPIVFILDGRIVDSLNIDSGLKGKVATEVKITGGGTTFEDAYTKMKKLQAVLESGALPTSIEIVKIDSISPLLGQEFARIAAKAVILAIVAVSLFVIYRYRDPRIFVPIMLTGLCEILLILGFAALVGWTIDLAAIAGIIAAVGTGVDDQIVITAESKTRRERIESIRQKLRNAFFVIFTSYFTTVAAMTPLLFVGAGSVKGFAFTTILGVTIGVLITRPAFAKIIEWLEE